MKKRLFSLKRRNEIIMSLICIGISACADFNDVTSNDVAGNDNEIIFEVDVDGVPYTRAPKVTVSDFTTYGIYGVTSTGSKIATNNIYTYGNNGWTSTETMVWPKDQSVVTNFFSVNTSFDNMDKATFTKSTWRFDYTTPLNVADQLDLMVASALNMRQSTNEGKVPLSFKHIMCFLQIKAYQTLDEDYVVTFGRVAIHNVDVTARSTFSKTTKSTVTTVLSGNYQTITKDMTDAPFEVPYGTKATNALILTPTTDYYVMYMQKLTKWATTDTNPVPITEADANHHCYAEIDFKIQDKGGNYIYGSETEWGKSYAPISVNFTEANQTKTASIKFTGGYDENGIPLSFGSGFEIVAEDWEPGNENNEPIEVEF